MHEIHKTIDLSRQDKLAAPFFHLKENPAQIMQMVNKAEEHFKLDVSLAGFKHLSAHTSSVHGFK